MKIITASMISASILMAGCSDSGLKDMIEQQKIDNATPTDHYTLSSIETNRSKSVAGDLGFSLMVEELGDGDSKACFDRLKAETDHQLAAFNREKGILEQRVSDLNKAKPPAPLGAFRIVDYQIKSMDVAISTLQETVDRQSEVCGSL